jgi:hypothetical protein
MPSSFPCTIAVSQFAREIQDAIPVVVIKGRLRDERIAQDRIGLGNSAFDGRLHQLLRRQGEVIARKGIVVEKGGLVFSR